MNVFPKTDPTPIFEAFRGNQGTELLTAAVAHLGFFKILGAEGVDSTTLRERVGLAERPFVVLTTALRAFGLLDVDESGKFRLTEMAAEHLVPGGAFDVSGYLGLAAQSAGVLEIVNRLRTNRPAGAEDATAGAAFIYREGLESAMEQEASARSLTLALAGRARNVAPHLARNYPIPKAKVLLDVGGGTGIYSIAWLLVHAELKAVVWDRPEVLKVAREMANEFGVGERLETIPGDMFRDPLPLQADVILLSNILHDWDVEECQNLIQRCSDSLPSGGELLIHDVFLNDAMDGPLSVALYSASLFQLTEGRAYSGQEYRSWLERAGLVPSPVVPTLVHCGLLPSRKS